MAPETPRRAQRLGAVGAGALTLGALTYVGLVDPHQPGALFPPCPFRMLTGWYCPGCGGLRMTHDLLHGDIPAAAVDNVFVLAGLPLLGLWLLWCRRRGVPALTPAVLVVIAVAVTVWTVVRNLPGFPLLPTLS